MGVAHLSLSDGGSLWGPFPLPRGEVESPCLRASNADPAQRCSPPAPSMRQGDCARGGQCQSPAARRDAEEEEEEGVALLPLPAAVLFREFAFEELLGRGRYGSVWRCRERATGARFACKQVPKAGTGAGLLQLQQELDSLAQAQGHRHVVALEEVFESPSDVFILTELCAAGDLFTHVQRRGRLGEAEARRLFRQLMEAVRHCHAQGILHRDIKPENVLLKENGRGGVESLTVKLADFGLSTALGEDEAALGCVGSKPYEAPEVFLLRHYDFSADIFSAGVVLFAMLSGNWPTLTEDHEFASAHSFSHRPWQGVSAECKHILTAMLSRTPHMRPTAQEVLEHPWLHGEASARGSPTGSDGDQLCKGEQDEAPRNPVGAAVESAAAMPSAASLGLPITVTQSGSRSMMASQPLPYSRTECTSNAFAVVDGTNHASLEWEANDWTTLSRGLPTCPGRMATLSVKDSQHIDFLHGLEDSWCPLKPEAAMHEDLLCSSSSDTSHPYIHIIPFIDW